jgi:replicative DNA helicase
MQQTKAQSAEKDLLSACFAGGARVTRQAFEVLSPEDFSDPRHVAIATTLAMIVSQNKGVDLAVLKTELGDEGVPAAGGLLYLKEIKRHYSSLENVETYIRQVKDRSMVRHAEVSLMEIIDQIRKDAAPDEVRKGLDALYLSLVDESINRPTPSKAAVEQLMANARAKYDSKGELLGDPFTGIPSLDSMLDGIQAGDVIGFFGRPKTGKSSIFNSIAEYHARKREAISIISGEMPLLSTTARLVAAGVNLPYRYIRKGEFYKNPDDIKKVEEYKESLLGNNVFLGKESLSIPYLNYHVRSMYHEKGVTRFAIDRIGRFQEVSTAKGSGDHRERGLVVDAMRNLVNDLPIAIITAGQVTQAADLTSHKRPEGYQVYGGTNILGNLTKAVMIYNPYAKKLETFQAGPYEGQQAKGFAELFVAAGNDLEEGSVKVRFVGDKMFFKENENWDEHFTAQDAPTPDENVNENMDDDDLPF